MRISKILWISGFLTIGVAINLYALPANASTACHDSFMRVTEGDGMSQTIAPYRGSGR